MASSINRRVNPSAFDLGVSTCVSKCRPVPKYVTKAFILSQSTANLQYCLAKMRIFPCSASSTGMSRQSIHRHNHCLSVASRSWYHSVLLLMTSPLMFLMPCCCSCFLWLGSQPFVRQKLGVPPKARRKKPLYQIPVIVVILDFLRY
jgi:hypothetical protein